jgi:hypothetical protein
MRIWRCYYHDNDSGSGTVNVWATSKAKLFKALREDDLLTEEQRRAAREVAKPLTITTTREGIVRFLNIHAETF